MRASTSKIWVQRCLAGGFAFFLIKGLVWLALTIAVVLGVT